MKTTIVLIRHGELVFQYNDKGQKLVYGQEAPLSEVGRKQTEELATRMRVAGIRLDRIYTSPYPRTLTTSQILSRELSVESIIEERLRDVHAPGYVGITMDELLSFDGDIYGRSPRTPDQETYEEMTKRVTTAIDEIVKRHRGEVIGIVSHGDELRVLTQYLMHPDMPIPPYAELVGSAYMKKAEALCITIDSKTQSIEQQLIGRNRGHCSAGRSPEIEDLST